MLTRAAVVAATRRMIERDGLDRVSLRRVAATLGVTAPALYAYVDDKRDLLRAVAESAFADLVTRFEAVAVDDPLDRLRAQSHAYVGFALDEPELFRTMFLFPPQLDVTAPIGEELPAATQAFEVARRGIDDAIAAGALREGDPTMAALTLWTATHGAAEVLRMGFGFDEAGRHLLVETVLDTVLTGMRA